jgi:HEAT repeat protein
MATLKSALASNDQSVRLKAALAAGTFPNTEHIEDLVHQCAIDPDFFVRDTLSWALMRHDRATVVARLKIELESKNPQAKSQAIHTFSKIGDSANFSLITDEMLFDIDDLIASTAWRAASVLVPDSEKRMLIEKLITQLGRGDSDLQFSLTRFLCTLGAEIIMPLEEASSSTSEEIRTHASFTLMRFNEMELDAKKDKPNDDGSVK